ncbi:hypothetical protein SNR26_10000 [Pectobacterium brasiliense]|uniref:hypothetical protein n=1 Tax=Pectobacterium brasiliense TaxID=180957 RepID=UPI002A830108|nr:hypothetical protein [Pectobacterium brasiliense]MDY4368051.1 hypothetical protein [Pectobacterium brasiliense]MDY7057583.1 hypothetical protein [Pectobacterium brasiliense]
MKKIGIAIPTYNRVEHLTRLVDSIPQSINLGISDNGAYIKDSLKWDNAKVVQHVEVIPMFNNWNESISILEDCDFLAITSDDDFYLENAFDVVSEYINAYDCDMFIFGCNTIDENDFVTGRYCPEKLELLMPGAGIKYNFYHIPVRMPAIFFKKTFLEKIGCFDVENFKITASDSELIQRALILGKSLYVPIVIANYRMWGGNATSNTIATKQWLMEIKNWTGKIKKLALEINNDALKLDWTKYEDEVLALNILAGLSLLRRKKEYEKLLAHYRMSGIPKKARLITKLRIIKQVLVSKVEGLRSV